MIDLGYCVTMTAMFIQSIDQISYIHNWLGIFIVCFLFFVGYHC